MHQIKINYKSKGFTSISAFNLEYLSKVKPLLESKLIAYKTSNVTRREIIDFIIDNIDDILIGRPEVLSSLLETFSNNGYQDYLDTNPSFSKKILSMFGYEGFRKAKSKGIWLGESIGTKACLYCNSQFTLNLKESGQAAYTFDHFFTKDRFPFLSTSLYNLIPCCSHCNQRKSYEDYTLEELPHPYLESFDDYSTFRTDPQSIIEFVNGLYKNEDLIKLDAVYTGNSSDTLSMLKFANQYEQFAIGDVYENHKDVVAEIYIKSKIYTKSFRKYLKCNS